MAADTVTKKLKPQISEVTKLTPGTNRYNLRVKVLSVTHITTKRNYPNSSIAECYVADKTGKVIFTARKAQINQMVVDSIVILRNAKIDMFNGRIRVAIDQWGRIEVDTQKTEFPVNNGNDVSAVEYELVSVTK